MCWKILYWVTGTFNIASKMAIKFGKLPMFQGLMNALVTRESILGNLVNGIFNMAARLVANLERMFYEDTVKV